MYIVLNNVGKRFNREWIFRYFNYTFESGKTYAVTGPNGSGKSTLLQVIAGAILYNEGTVEIKEVSADEKITTDNFYKCITIAAPYLELIEEMTASEMLNFHHQFKTLSLSVKEILHVAGLENAAHKQLRYFSSGMKQRLKLAQAFFSCTPVLLLDEPTTNLDADGIALYHQLIQNHSKNRLVIISSNDKQEYDFCSDVININEYKST